MHHLPTVAKHPNFGTLSTDLIGRGLRLHAPYSPEVLLTSITKSLPYIHQDTGLFFREDIMNVTVPIAYRIELGTLG